MTKMLQRLHEELVRRQYSPVTIPSYARIVDHFRRQTGGRGSYRYWQDGRVAAHAMELASRQRPAIAHVEPLERPADCCSPTGCPARQRRNNGRSSLVRSNPRNAAGIRASRRFDR